MAATNKTDLSEITEKEFAKLTALVERVDGPRALIKVDGVSIKDVIGHRAHWISLFLGWFRDGQAGRVVHMPAEGYKWNQLNAFNAKLRETQASLGWEDARLLLSDAHRDLIAFIADHSDTTLYAAPMKGGNGKWTTGRFAEAAGASHYRSAAKFVRAMLKPDRTNGPV